MTSHDVSVVCGNSSGQGEVYLPVVSVSQSPVTCVCKAVDQEASCYFKTSNVTFDVTGEWNYISCTFSAFLYNYYYVSPCIK